MNLPHPSTNPGAARKPQAAGQAAFSLLEIMVAVALLAVIIVGLMAMFYQVQRAFRAGTSQGDLMEHGRAVMNLFTTELQQASATDMPFVTNLAILPSLTPAGASILNAASLQDLPSGAQGQAEQRANYLKDISFFSRQNDEWVFTSYRLSNAVSGVGTLYRMVVRESTNNPYFLSTRVSTLTTYNDMDGNFHRVADGVVHFYMEAYDHNGLIASNALNTPVLGNYAFTNELMPAYLDIELGVLEPSTYEKFKARAENDPDQTTFATAKGQYLSQKAGRVQMFRQRVTLRGPASNGGY